MKEIMKKHNWIWLKNPGHPYRILIMWGCRSGKTNLIFNPISHQQETDKLCLYAKDQYQAKYLNY